MPPILEGAAVGSVKMSDEDEREIREILERFTNGPQSKDAMVRQVKHTVEAYLESGPGTREARQLVALRKLREIDATFRSARSTRN
jgi:hypothetical protein